MHLLHANQRQSTLSLNPMKLVTSIFAELKKGERTWLSTYWLLFDLLSTMESALVQLYIDASAASKDGREEMHQAMTRDGTLGTLLDMRKILLDAVFRIPRSDQVFSRACVRGSLTTALMCWRVREHATEVSATLCCSNVVSRLMHNPAR